MLRITKESDYAIMLLVHLSEAPTGQIVTAREIAERTGLPLPMVGKILRGLVREGVLSSHRGGAGGYSFDRSASDTSVAEVIRAVEGPISMVQCGAEPGACDQEPSCPTRPNWVQISRAIEATLEGIPISSMRGERRAGESLLALADDASDRVGPRAG